MASDSHREWKAFFDYCEKDMRSNPTHFKYQKAYYRLGKRGFDKFALFFPVEIRSGRVSFGKIQFLITPFGVEKGVLGERWVERKTLIMEHDIDFKRFELSVMNEQ